MAEAVGSWWEVKFVTGWLSDSTFGHISSLFRKGLMSQVLHSCGPVMPTRSRSIGPGPFLRSFHDGFELKGNKEVDGASPARGCVFRPLEL